MDAVEEKVKKLISKHLGRKINELENSQSLKNDLAGDSLDFVSLILALEEELNVQVDDAEASKIQTIQDAIDLYRRLMKPH